MLAPFRPHRGVCVVIIASLVSACGAVPEHEVSSGGPVDVSSVVDQKGSPAPPQGETSATSSTSAPPLKINDTLPSTPLLPSRVLLEDELVATIPFDAEGDPPSDTAIRVRSVTSNGQAFVEIDLQAVAAPVDAAYWIVDFNGSLVLKTSVGQEEQAVLGIRDRRSSIDEQLEVVVSAVTEDGRILATTDPVLLGKKTS